MHVAGESPAEPPTWFTSPMRDINFGADEIRTILHLLAVSVWLGGQILMMGLVPVLRKLGGDAPRAAAGAFATVAWPAFVLAVVTGIWNIFAVDLANVSSGYNAVFGIKMLLVVATGFAAFVHQRTDKASIRGMTGALGFIAALGAVVIGVLMSH